MKAAICTAPKATISSTTEPAAFYRAWALTRA